jgi:hypothetical protein
MNAFLLCVLLSLDVEHLSCSFMCTDTVDLLPILKENFRTLGFNLINY